MQTKALPPPVSDDFCGHGRLLAPGCLHHLGVYGYGALEDIILAALISGDPLLLIGKAGTGKTYLLNSLSEALGLEHRHYNASLIAFDDLVGFPFPDKDGSAIRYIQTPATIWQAESVLIDELSRCKPEHQNRLFSLVHERRIQGLDLPALRYRWAAMNPCGPEDGEDFYEGSQALDQALADRFAFILEVPDWEGLNEKDRRLVADARGVNRQSFDAIGLGLAVKEGRKKFEEASATLHEFALTYAAAVASELLRPGVRLSPRRVRQLSRNLIALTIVSGGPPDSLVFRNCLLASIPQLAWGVRVPDPVIRGAHATAWDFLTQNEDSRWLTRVLHEANPAKRCQLLLNGTASPDTVTMGVRQSLIQLPGPEAAVVALALLPVAQKRPSLLGEEALAAIAQVAVPILEVEGEVRWRLQNQQQPDSNPHPALSACSTLLGTLPKARQARARQLFYHCIVREYPIPDAVHLERCLDQAIRAVKPFLTISTA
jgi:MoxR-like ATPase